MKEAVQRAANGGATGENVKKGFIEEGLGARRSRGRLQSLDLHREDHRGTLKVDLYRMKVTGATDAPLNDLVKKGGIKMDKVKTIRPAAQARTARLVSKARLQAPQRSTAFVPREGGGSSTPQARR